MPKLPTLLLSRRPRRVGVDWTSARSWLGGAPRLGTIPWPRGKDGLPLHFVAQIDFAEIAAKIDATPFPAKGALAFFIGGGGRGGGGSVIHLSEPYDNTPTFPPADTPELTAYGGSADWRTDLSGRPLYPFWPLDFTVLDGLPAADSDDGHIDEVADQVAAVNRHFARREYILSPGLAFAGSPIPDWWQMAHKLADDLAKAGQNAPDVMRQEQHRLDHVVKKLEQAHSEDAAEVKQAEALVAMYETSLATLQRQQPALLAFVTEVETWVAGRDPWAVMTPQEKAHLASLWARNTEFPKFTGYYGIGPVDHLKDKMFKALPAADTPAFAAFPDSVRQLINEWRTPRPQWWHSAIHFAKSLRHAVKIHVPSLFKVTRDGLEASRKTFDQMRRPKGMLALFGRKPQGDSKKLEELEAWIVSSEAKLAELTRLEPLFLRFVQETSTWAEAHDPWAFMTDADIEQLHARMKRAATEFKDLARYARTRIEDLETMTLRALATADDAAYATLPEPVRNVINREYLLPSGVWHQMFGTGCQIQDGSMREEGYIMILQLNYDDMMHWDFGDDGVYQFWMLPEDLAKQNWGAAQMTFDCH